MSKVGGYVWKVICDGSIRNVAHLVWIWISWFCGQMEMIYGRILERVFDPPIINTWILGLCVIGRIDQ